MTGVNAARVNLNATGVAMGKVILQKAFVVLCGVVVGGVAITALVITAARALNQWGVL